VRKKKIFFEVKLPLSIGTPCFMVYLPRKNFFEETLTRSKIYLEDEVKKREIEDSGIYPL
jgi:hypothetical protein